MFSSQWMVSYTFFQSTSEYNPKFDLKCSPKLNSDVPAGRARKLFVSFQGDL